MKHAALAWLLATLGWLAPAAAQAQGAPAGGIEERVEPGHCPPVPPPPAADSGLQALSGQGVDRGMLWRLQRDGRTSWLYGTLHLGRPGWERLGPRVAAALRASEVLALEIDLEDPQLARQMDERAQQAVDTGAPQALPPALAERLQAAASRGCFILGDSRWMPPLMQIAALTLQDGRWLGLDGAFGQERTLIAAARVRGMPVIGLESLDRQLQALELPEDQQQPLQQLDQALQQLEDGSARLGLMRLAQAWQRGDLQALEDYEQWCECAPTEQDRELLRQINDARNPGLAQGISDAHARGQRIFAAVGALHMTGAKALPALLARHGFRVQRVVLNSEARVPGRTMLPDSPRQSAVSAATR